MKSISKNVPLVIATVVLGVIVGISSLLLSILLDLSENTFLTLKRAIEFRLIFLLVRGTDLFRSLLVPQSLQLSGIFFKKITAQSASVKRLLVRQCR